MNRITTTVTILFILFTSCQKPEVSELISEPSRFSDFRLTVDTVRIQLNEFQKFIYPKFGTFEHNDSLHLVGYNDQTHAFDFFNLDGDTFEKSIPLEREGPNAITEVIGFTPLNINSLYILSSYQLSRIDEKGTIKEKLRINTTSSGIAGHDPDEYMFWLETNQPLYYEASTNSIYAMNHSYLYGQCDPKRYKDASLVAQLDLNKERISTLPVSYPSDKAENSYGFINKVFTEWTDRELIYNFQYDPNFYVMDLKSKKTKVYDGRSDYTSNEVTPISWSECQGGSKRLEHLAKEVNFGKILKNSHNGLSYRFHRKELTIDNPQPNDFNKKKLFLSIFDDEYAKVGEFILKNRPYPSHVSFTGKKGLYVAAPENNQETLVFYIFNIEPLVQTEQKKMSSLN